MTGISIEAYVLHLRERKLLHDAAHIDGNWIAEGGGRLEVRNPATGEIFAMVPDIGAAGAEEAIAAASRALPAWRAMTPKARAEILARRNNLLLEQCDDLALLLTLEQGKPLTEARGEIVYGASFLSWFAAEARRVYGDIINAGIVSTDVAPFGGVKESGLGREGSKYGLEEFLERKYVCVGIHLSH